MRKNYFLVVFLLTILLLILLCTDSSIANCDCYDLSERFTPSNLINRIKGIIESENARKSTGLSTYDINLLKKQIEERIYQVLGIQVRVKLIERTSLSGEKTEKIVVDKRPK